MHIRDGMLSPAVCLATGVLSAAAVGYSLRRMRRELADRTVPYTGMTAALIFAAQMVNFPLFFEPVSGHLIGGVLAAALLGPWAGCVALTLVLVVQALLFADGGLLSLGANTFNMAVVGTWSGWCLYAGLRKLLGASAGATVASAACAAYLSVLAAAVCFCIEFGLSHSAVEFDLGRVFALMLLFHAAIGLGEALITGFVVRWLIVRRPEMLTSLAPAASAPWPTKRYLLAALGCAAMIAVLLSPFKSPLDDGLDSVSQQVGFDELGRKHPLVLGEYEIPFWAGAWEPLSVWAAGLLGTLVVFVIGWLLGRMIQVRPVPQSE